MSLFIGNISRNVEQKTMEATLNSFGPCKIEFRVIANRLSVLSLILGIYMICFILDFVLLLLLRLAQICVRGVFQR